jgi:cell wall-active antibiotic response 4TMS protein YvqF
VARPFRPEVLVFGLVLIALGVVWMLGNAGRIDTLATLRAWWPASLVLWGALELVAYAVDRRAGRSSR